MIALWSVKDENGGDRDGFGITIYFGSILLGLAENRQRLKGLVLFYIAYRIRMLLKQFQEVRDVISRECFVFPRRNKKRIERRLGDRDAYQVISDRIPPIVLLQLIEAGRLLKHYTFRRHQLGFHHKAVIGSQRKGYFRFDPAIRGRAFPFLDLTGTLTSPIPPGTLEPCSLRAVCVSPESCDEVGVQILSADLITEDSLRYVKPDELGRDLVAVDLIERSNFDLTIWQYFSAGMGL